MPVLFNNNTFTTVSSGGTTAPAPGTVETWTVLSAASFPVASSTLGTFFMICNPAQPTEKVLVTNTAGTTFTVTRGAEGTTPIANPPNFPIVEITSAQTLSSFPQWPSGGWQPSDNGFDGATMDPLSATGTLATTAGTLYLWRFPVKQAFTLNNVIVCVTSAGVGASTGSFVGAYSSTGSLLTGSADVGASLTSTGTKALAVTTAQNIDPGTNSVIYIALLVNLATTQPTLQRGNANTMALFNQSGAGLRFATNGTALSALPGSITLSGNSTSGAQPWLIAIN